MLKAASEQAPVDVRDPLVAAELASLNYVTDDQPGIRRRQRGKLFGYYDENGQQIRDEATLARIRALAIPPAYTDVWICPDPDGHLQATGRDLRGRKQYRYHPRWAEIRDSTKYGSLIAFGRALPAIRERIDADLRRRGLPKERVLASIVWLLENTLIRVGNHTYARENKSYGLTTLRDRHVQVNGSKLQFKFKGKSGKEWNLHLVDRRIIRIVRSAQDLPGQHLFQYEQEDGGRGQIRSEDVNRYIREISGSEFTSKHFRTWAGTVTAALLFRDLPLPQTKSATSRVLNATVDQVAARLGNTRAVCRRSYIHPQVIQSWTEGRLQGEMAAARRSFRKPIDGLDDDETLVLKWLIATHAT